MESTHKLRWKDRREKHRRVWSYKEERVLISTLKEYCRIGWKSDTGVFKAGYIIALEKALIKAFPNTDLRAAPHIESKLHVWKKQYTTLSAMLAMDGISWDDAACRIVLETEDALQAFFREHPKLYDVNMTHKTFPYYKDWKDIFGKDKPADNLAGGPSHAVDEILEEEASEDHEAAVFIDISPFVTETPPEHERDAAKQTSPETRNEDRDFVDGSTSVTENPPDQEKAVAKQSSKETRNKDLEVVEFVDGSTSATEPRPNHERETLKRKSKKMRPCPDRMTDDVSSLSASLHALTEKIDEGFGRIAQRLGYDQDVAVARRELYPTLTKLPGLQTEDRLKAADRIARDPHRIDVFFSLPDEEKVKMVKMLLDGRM